MYRLLVVFGLALADPGSWNVDRGMWTVGSGSGPAIHDVRSTFGPALRTDRGSWAPVAAQAVAADKALAAERERIDAIDARIVSLLNERAKIVQQIGRIKQKAGMPVAAPSRAEEVRRKAAGHNTGPLSAAAVKRIYERIIEEMTALELKNGS